VKSDTNNLQLFQVDSDVLPNQAYPKTGSKTSSSKFIPPRVFEKPKKVCPSWAESQIIDDFSSREGQTKVRQQSTRSGRGTENVQSLCTIPGLRVGDLTALGAKRVDGTDELAEDGLPLWYWECARCTAIVVASHGAVETWAAHATACCSACLWAGARRPEKGARIDDGEPDTPLASWRARLALTCPGCGCRSIRGDGRCGICGAQKEGSVYERRITT
jgi:hypothetical protein